MTDHLTEVTVAAYVDGMLSRNERYAVEQHLADCDQCRHEVGGVSSLIHGRRRARRYVVPLTAAAAVALIAIGLKGANESRTPVFRSGGAQTALVTISPGNEHLVSTTPTLTWQSLEDAGQYRVTVTNSAGDVVAEKVTTDTTTLLSSLPSATTFQWYVTAVMKNGAVESSPVTSFRTQ